MAEPSMSPLTLDLDAELRQRLYQAAERQGVSLPTLCERWLVQELRRYEDNQGVAAEASGRCSVRTGLSSTGPIPLPLQQ
jgi:hypothetical protein